MHYVSSANKRWLGFGGLWLAAFRLLLKYDFPTLRISGIDERGLSATERGTSVIVSNIRYWASANRVIPQADPSDAMLDVVVLQEASVAHLAAFWLRLMSPVGHPLQLRGVRYLRLTTVDISLEHGRPVELHLNGEARGYVPISLLPGPEVQVLAPVV
jgi:diacylglycerol kinase family enzyme